MSEKKGNEIFSIQEGMVSPKFIASADVHLGLALYNTPELEADLMDNFVRLCDLAVEKQVEYLVIAGDLFENNRQDPSTIVAVRTQVTRLEAAGIKLVGIAGDHDKPIDGESWCNVSGLLPVTVCPQFAGVDFYDYSAQGETGLIEQLKHQRDPAQVQWIFLHAQFPQIYSAEYSSIQKTVDLSKVKLFEHFPNLLGVVAGDIHFAPETFLEDKEHQAYLGYCGSLGITDIAETKYDHSVLYCDGSKFYRLPFAQRRVFLRIDFTEKNYEKFNPELLIREYENAEFKPVFYVDYDSVTDQFRSRVRPLYAVGYVRWAQTTRNLSTGALTSMPDIRAGLKSDDKVTQALTETCAGVHNKDVPGLLQLLLTAEDPKQVLNEFRGKAGL